MSSIYYTDGDCWSSAEDFWTVKLTPEQNEKLKGGYEFITESLDGETIQVWDHDFNEFFPVEIKNDESFQNQVYAWWRNFRSTKGEEL